MRRSYAEKLRTALFPGPGDGPGRAARLGTTARLGTKALLARLRPGLCPPLLAPILATAVVTERCNLNCPFCTTHRTTGALPHIDRLLHTVNSVASLGADAVGFTGGEPLLLSRFEDAVKHATTHGLVTHLNTNGTLIDPHRAESLLGSGLDSINISIDGATGDRHDLLRGRGSFAKAIAGARHLVAARDRTGAKTRIRLVMALGDRNAADATALPRLAGETGVDGCSFIPVHGAPPSLPAAQAAATLARSRDRTIDNSRAYLIGMSSFLAGAAMPRRCSALRTSLVVATDGTAHPCVPAYSFGWSRGVPTAGKSLATIFKSGALDATLNRDRCSLCWWNCHRELDIALGIL